MIEAPNGLSRRYMRRLPLLVRPLIPLVLLASLGFAAVSWSGCGGGNACEACRDDCRKNNIPLPDCNCKGSCPGT